MTKWTSSKVVAQVVVSAGSIASLVAVVGAGVKWTK